jgi:hypothetical protein
MGRIFPNGPVVALTLLSLALAGCGSVHAGTGSPGGAASTSARSESQSPQARAKADAAAILAAFVPPPGASRLGTAPNSDGDALSQPIYREDTPDIVDDADWWRVPGLSSRGVIEWEKAHLSHRFTVRGWGGPVEGDPAIEQWWSLPDVAGVLLNRQLMVTALGDGSSTFLRVDADVDWLPARPAWSMLAAPSIRAVVVTAVPGGNDKKKPPAQVTVTDPVKVRKLVELLNAQPTFPPGVHSCPFGDGRGLRLTFLSAVKGAVLATAFAASNGCGGVGLTVGHRQVGLGWGPGVAQETLAISGMNWKLFGYLPM